MPRLSQAVLIGLATALSGLLLQATPLQALETDIGLEWLFQIRGPEPAPDEVVVVTIDKESSAALGLPNLPRKWPRDLHAQLVDRLHQAGARVVAFDIIFSEPREPKADQRFAQALKASGNVILFDYLETSRGNGLQLEKHHPPMPLLQHAARAVAPFALPKVPEKINQAWLYKTVSHLPTIPVVALHLFVLPELKAVSATAPVLKKLLTPASPVRQIQYLRKQLLQQPSLATYISQADGHLPAWLAAMQQHDGIFLNFYGAARAITTIPYYHALEWDNTKMRQQFEGKAVFVGFSERLQPEQKDGFYTVFTNRAGLDISGVEIMATTFANLLKNHAIRPSTLSLKILLIAGFGLLAGVLLYLTPGYWALLAGIGIAGGYLSFASWLFSTKQLWLPLTTPLLFQLPLALVAAMLGHYLLARKQRQQLDGIIRQYLPAHIADTAFKDDATHARREGDTTLAAAMITDAEAFTPLSETLSAAALHQRINRYFELLLPCIDAVKGQVTDINGDAVLALWRYGDESARKQAACLAAIAIQQQLREHPETSLTTRIGLHWGEIALGNIGNGGHYEYRAVGETINTTSRLETLNKTLGTRILASDSVLQGCDDILYRPLGEFLLVGKSTPLGIREIQGLLHLASPSQLLLNQQFSVARQAWLARDFSKAAQLFEAIHATFNDPVSAFFLQHCRSFQAQPPNESWQGVTVLQQK